MMNGILEILEELKRENKKLKTMLDDADLYISDIKIQKEIVLEDNRKLRKDNENKEYEIVKQMNFNEELTRKINELQGENKRLKKLQDFSLNDYVYVKLINDGEEILVDYYSKCEDCDREFVFKIHNYRSGWIKIQLWELFNIFGRHIHMGNNKLPFEISNCKLEVK